MRKIIGKLDLFIWVLIFSGVIFMNLSLQLISKERIYLLGVLTAILTYYLSDRFIFQRFYLLKKNIVRLLVLIVYLFSVFCILNLWKNNLWIFYIFPALVAFSLSLTFVTHPRAWLLILVMVSLFVLGEIYWESRIPPEKLIRVEFPLPFVKIYSLSLLAIFGYYLYRNQLTVRKTLEGYNQTLKNLNEELKRKTEELEKTNKRLQELSEAKSVFVTTVSHELRTPLTAILNALKLIGYETQDNRKVSEYTEIIKKNIDRQSIMIDNLLDAAKLERGTLEMKRTFFELNKLLSEIVETMRIQANAKQIELNFSPLERDSFLWGEEEGLRRVFLNLLDNSIKFTSQGGKVNVAVSKEGDNLKVVVSDTGCGIPKEELEKIFEPFVQLEINQPAKRGIGLGLAIVREIVNRHQGKVWVESEVNKGSNFFVLLPIDLRKSKR